jgi:hypothetical protein
MGNSFLNEFKPGWICRLSVSVFSLQNCYILISDNSTEKRNFVFIENDYDEKNIPISILELAVISQDSNAPTF